MQGPKQDPRPTEKQDTDPEQDPKPTEKQDTDPDPKKIIPDVTYRVAYGLEGGRHSSRWGWAGWGAAHSHHSAGSLQNAKEMTTCYEIKKQRQKM